MVGDRLPLIVVIDDQPETLLGGQVELGLRGRASFEVVHPQDVTVSHLERADLVLVDFLLEHWPERDRFPLAMQPSTGLALAAVLREHVDKSQQDRLTAFALHSGHLEQTRGRVPGRVMEHLVAHLNNLEWAFKKADERRWDQMVALAEAVQQLPRKWPAGNYDRSEEAALSLLALPQDAHWFESARRSVLACQPPIHDLNDGAHGLLFIRWVLHQVMPYPTFLWREEWVAARLRMSVESLRAILHAGGRLSADLEKIKYGGVLKGFAGDRWWRVALENYVWDLTSGQSVDVDTLHGKLRERTQVRFDALAADAGIVCLGEDFAPTGRFIAATDAVRLRPDNWPAFADDAWTSVALASDDPFLGAVVDPNDAPRLLVDSAAADD